MCSGGSCSQQQHRQEPHSATADAKSSSKTALWEMLHLIRTINAVNEVSGSIDAAGAAVPVSSTVGYLCCAKAGARASTKHGLRIFFQSITAHQSRAEGTTARLLLQAVNASQPGSHSSSGCRMCHQDCQQHHDHPAKSDAYPYSKVNFLAKPSS